MLVSTPEDRFSLKLAEIELIFSPLTKRQKLEVVKLGALDSGQEINKLDMAIRSIQYCLKDAKGFTKRDGSEFELEFETPDKVSEKSVDVILNSTLSNAVVEASMQFIVGVPDVLKNVATGDEIKDIEIKYLGDVAEVKKKKH